MIGPGKKTRLVFLNALPGFITLVLAILSLSVKHLSGFNHFMPALAMIPIFYWGLMQRRHMPYGFVFLLGLLMDAMMGLPLGLSSLLYMVFLLLIRTQHKYIHKEGFVIKWGYFALLLGVVAIFNAAMLVVFHIAGNFQPAFLQWLLTICCYPLLHQLFDRIQEYIQHRRWQLLHSG